MIGKIRLKLIGVRDKDGRIFNLPTAEEIVALIIGDFDGAFDKRDIIVQTQSGDLQRISELHPSYLALQYPLIFPYGEDGFRLGIKHRGVSVDCDILRTNNTMREYFSYIIQDRANQFSLLLNAQKLFQQFLVDSYTMIESARLAYIKTQQPKLRSQTFKNLNQSVQSGQSDASNCGKRILLPSSFTGGARYMMQKYLDVMAICKAVGYPDPFITVTCNPNWPEIYRCLKDKRLNPQDRPDIIARLFKIKINHLIQDFKKHKFFGGIQAIIYTIEFQKRGLPHAHICLFLSAENRFPTAKEIDLVISVEIPDKEMDAELYELVKQFMIHGPCGTDNPHCPCMVNLKCSKKFPKKYVDETCVDSEGYPVYQRRQSCNTVEKNGVLLDNRFVVPYNAILLKKYQCHINVEWCNQTGSIKYLFKYINKGPDRVTAYVYESTTTANVNPQNEEMTNNENLSNEREVDDVKAYLDCRYISTCEAAWRIFKFNIHYRFPPVEILPIHCEDGQAIVYDDNSNLCDVNESTKQIIERYCNLLVNMKRVSINKDNEELIEKLADALPHETWGTYLMMLRNKKGFSSLTLSKFIEKIEAREMEQIKISRMKVFDGEQDIGLYYKGGLNEKTTNLSPKVETAYNAKNSSGSSSKGSNSNTRILRRVS
ncbi:uncharacterized protein LOC110870109 [Helianthus annuus]|uniref:uncharacterized protein LOC110870109 n=1 Tax=Helianthus annuus TaxID=4232 RepID=UPI001652CBB1|nr:uncharacterized protein LOC110870109 [Helianthus annuus]